MQELNSSYRGVDEYRVLSFPSLNHQEKFTRQLRAFRRRCCLDQIAEQAGILWLLRTKILSFVHSVSLAYTTIIVKKEITCGRRKSILAGGAGKAAIMYRELFQQAEAVMQFAYAPYSNYRVGAAYYQGRQMFTVVFENSSYGGTPALSRLHSPAVAEGAGV
jgi:hypothetical protein